MDNGTFVKLNRGILEWEWYKDSNTKAVFIHLILKANIKPGGFMGVKVNRGELATSLASLSAETGLTVKQVRTALEHLKSTGEVAITRHSKFSVISICSYDLYQSTGQTEGTGRASKGQSKGIGRAINKEIKNDKNKRKQESLLSGKHEFGHLMLTDEEYSELESLCEGPGQMVEYVDKVSAWLAVNKVDPKNHYRVFRKFLINDGILMEANTQ